LNFLNARSAARSNVLLLLQDLTLPTEYFGAMSAVPSILTEQFPQDWQSLERALSGDRDENIARLYLGSTLIEEGDRQRGLEEIESGMRGSPVFSITLSNPGI
jgi:hypothetical protein